MSDSPDARKRLTGVFSSQEVRKVGTGTTTRKTIQKAFWMVEELDDGSLEVQPLNPNYIPSGPKKKVPRDAFLDTFSPEPEIYMTQVFPKIKSELGKTLARAERYRNNGELFSAEMEFGNALKVDAENVRANFGLGITYLERGEKSKADNIFERLVKLDAAFDVEHKHLFNEFGINLRKNGMLDQAMTYYKRAMELAVQDEHLYHNVARTCLEKKEVGQALDYLLKSLQLNPTLDVSVKFLTWMVGRKLVPADKKSEVAAMLAIIKDAQDGKRVPPPPPPAPEKAEADAPGPDAPEPAEPTRPAPSPAVAPREAEAPESDDGKVTVRKAPAGPAGPTVGGGTAVVFTKITKKK